MNTVLPTCKGQTPLSAHTVTPQGVSERYSPTDLSVFPKYPPEKALFLAGLLFDRLVSFVSLRNSL